MEDTTLNEGTTSSSSDDIVSDNTKISDTSSTNETTEVASTTKEDSKENVIKNTTVEKTTVTVKQEGNIMAAAKTQEETYDVQDLIDNCKALGYRREVVAGALLGCKKIEMTKTEFETTIKNFLGKKVK